MLRSLLLSLGLIGPLAASAQSLSFEGTLAVGLTDIGDRDTVGFVDATLAVPMGLGALSFELGGYLYALDGKRPHETYAAFAWDDTWRIGVVRPAYDAVLPSVFQRTAPYLSYLRTEYNRSHTTLEAMRRTAVPWGASWQQSFGQTDLAFSAHDASKGGFSAASLSVAHHGNGWMLAGAIETVWSPHDGHEGINAKVGAQFDIQQAKVGIAWLHPEANDRDEALSLDLAIPVTPKFDVLAFGEFTESGKDDAYGIAVDFKIRPDTSLLLAGTDGAIGPGAHLTLERRF
ncbi:hypothetical protein [Antarctobacter jejuensis]|uniref:hypothetical protein n=1 Tax=Antarctobacter jejuensis TaxID=1439938 RepID=UPI003FD4D9F5